MILNHKYFIAKTLTGTREITIAGIEAGLNHWHINISDRIKMFRDG